MRWLTRALAGIGAPRDPWHAVTCAVYAMLIMPHTAGAQATVRGVVRDSASGAAVTGAEVSVGGSLQRMRTDDDGSFHLPTAAGGQFTLDVRRLGFRPMSLMVRDAGKALEVALAALPLTLAPVLIQAERTRYSGRLAGYYERLEHRTQGQFITRGDIDRERPAQLTDMLQRAPGITVTHGRPGAQAVHMRGRSCHPLVWLDGAQMSAGDVDLDSFAPTTLEGVELYLGATGPPRFTAARGQSGCGTILLWSRGPDTEPPHTRQGVTPDELETLLASFGVYTSEQVDSAATPQGTAGWHVPYPPSLQAAGTSGVVTAEFVVDTLGHVEPAHIGIVSSTDRFFSVAVAEALPGAQFRPAMRRGRLVRQLVRQSFAFHGEAARH